jgi:hypothetical protein
MARGVLDESTMQIHPIVTSEQGEPRLEIPYLRLKPFPVAVRDVGRI